MKRHNFKRILPAVALCLLAAACSKDNGPAPANEKTRVLTIGCGIGQTDSKPGTRAGILPGNTDQSMESFIWHANDEFTAWLMPAAGIDYDPTPQTFAIESTYSDEAPSKSALFTCPYFPNEAASYKMLAVYPKGNINLVKPNKRTLTVTLAKEQTQTGKNNTRHLANLMNMYALATVNAGSKVPSLTFHHLTSLFRFTVTNKRPSDCRITEITMRESNNIENFGSERHLSITNWEEGTINFVPIAVYNEKKLLLRNSSTDEKGILLSAGSATDLTNVLDAYATVMPSVHNLNGKKFLFQIGVTSVDGKNLRNYISLELAGSKIFAANPGSTSWEPGKRYWFDLVLDDELTVTIKEVTPMPGWKNETDYIDY